MCTGQPIMSNQLLAHIHHSKGTFSRKINRGMMFHSKKRKRKNEGWCPMGCWSISPSIKAGLNDTSKKERPSDRTTFSSPLLCYCSPVHKLHEIHIQSVWLMSSNNICYILSKKITYATYSLRFLYLNLFFYLVTVVMYGQRLSSEGPYLLYNI
jgi:hypothetical protein